MSDYERYHDRAADAFATALILAVGLAIFALLGVWPAVAFACGIFGNGVYHTIRAIKARP